MSYQPFDLTGKSILVTGGASGIGFGMATALAQAGARLIIWGRRAERNEAAAAALRQYGAEILARSVDIADEAQINAGFEAAVAQCGVIDAVFANAGRTGVRTPFAQIDTASYRALEQTNQFGTFATLRVAAAHMVEVARNGGKPGSLVITGSASMIWGVPGNAAYAMTKGALDALIRSMAAEYGPYGIRVNSVLPGAVETGLARTPAIVAWMEANASMRRGGRPDEFGGIAVYLASDASSYQTGTSIIIDGGVTFQRGPAFTDSSLG